MADKSRDIPDAVDVAAPSPEEQEWIDHRVDTWVETYKKSMLTPVTLSLVATHQPAEISTIAEAVTAATGWQITERGLYRTIKRLQDSGFLESSAVDAPRTGAKRKLLSLTSLGASYLSGIKDNLVEVPEEN
ncbi:PadR family transcriptional regulator [Brevibacterium linens]|uniref:Transcriptional regulator PadR family protein n=1 Tax=Brevibacterium linens TaxID=1703 RepID=A0A0B9AJ75_BRELN|nr:PadR family transcriptional regulator [Brevibacterium linens]KHS50759.1 transcriptional regulator PadR family protein [Brevibacterium linens]